MITNISWDRLRKMIAARDNERCVYCNVHCPSGSLDHILPLSKGGTDSIDNLVWSCQSCNSSKHDKTLREWVKGNQIKAVSIDVETKKLARKFKILPDYKAQGFECDCGGYGYMIGTSQWLTYPGGKQHGHHHPDCPILVYENEKGKTGYYSARDSKITNGKINLCYVVDVHGSNRFWPASPETIDSFTKWLKNEYALRYKVLKIRRRKTMLAEIEHNEKYPYTGCFAFGGQVRTGVFGKWIVLIVLFWYGDGSIANYKEYAIENGYNYSRWIHGLQLTDWKKEKMFFLSAAFDLKTGKLKR